MNQHECRRKKRIEVNDNRLIVKGVIVLDPSKNYNLFPECKTCGYGSKVKVLESKVAPFNYHQIKTCTLRKVE